MKSDLDVDAGAVRDCASAMAGTVRGWPRGPPRHRPRCWFRAGRPPTPPSALTAAAQAWLATIASQVTAASRQLTATADDYEAADVRAAHRLRAVR